MRPQEVNLGIGIWNWRSRAIMFSEHRNVGLQTSFRCPFVDAGGDGGTGFTTVGYLHTGSISHYLR